MGSLRSLAVAVVGAGPAGFYACARLLRAAPNATVALVEKNIAPYGLVRYGVAPDHPEIKNVVAKFSALGSSPQVTYFGNVAVGSAVTVSELRMIFDAVVLCTGAGKSNPLPANIPGSRSVANVFSAEQFVGWYNGHPEQTSLEPNLYSSDCAVVIGNGNVALDIARILLRPAQDLKKTDISPLALQRLALSRIRTVRIVGRRGPLQAAFTTKELRETTRLDDTRVVLDPPECLLEAGEPVSRARRRQLELLRALPANNAATRTIYLDFMRSPESFHESNRNLTGVSFRHNRLDGEGNLVPGNGLFGDGVEQQSTFVSAGLAVFALGWRTVSPDPGIPVIGNALENSAGRVAQGLYAAGWLCTGPSGTLESALRSANSTVDMLLSEYSGGRQCVASEGTPSHGAVVLEASASSVLELRALLRKRQIKTVGWAEWTRIEQYEKKNATKVTLFSEMLTLADHPGSNY